MQASSHDNAPTGDRSLAPQIGRKLGLIVYWLLVCYIVIVAFVSLIPQVFGSGPARPTSCCAHERP